MGRIYSGCIVTNMSVSSLYYQLLIFSLFSFSLRLQGILTLSEDANTYFDLKQQKIVTQTVRQVRNEPRTR